MLQSRNSSPWKFRHSLRVYVNVHAFSIYSDTPNLELFWWDGRIQKNGTRLTNKQGGITCYKMPMSSAASKHDLKLTAHLVRPPTHLLTPPKHRNLLLLFEQHAWSIRKKYSSWVRTEIFTESCCQISKTIILGWEPRTLHHQSITFWGLVNAILTWKQAIPQTPPLNSWLNFVLYHGKSQRFSR